MMGSSRKWLTTVIYDTTQRTAITHPYFRYLTMVTHSILSLSGSSELFRRATKSVVNTGQPSRKKRQVWIDLLL
jgi:hypothetical protein